MSRTFFIWANKVCGWHITKSHLFMILIFLVCSSTKCHPSTTPVLYDLTTVNRLTLCVWLPKIVQKTSSLFWITDVRPCVTVSFNFLFIYTFSKSCAGYCNYMYFCSILGWLIHRFDFKIFTDNKYFLGHDHNHSHHHLLQDMDNSSD